VAIRNLVTGGTGLLGSHLAEQLAARGQQVRALVRPGSDVRFLQSLGAELVEGDLAAAADLARAVAGVDRVYHCAAMVGDWGPWRLYQSLVIDATRQLLEACQRAGVGRVLHVSSISVYGHPRGPGPWTEDEPLGQHLGLWEHYARSKIEAERECLRYPGELTMVRPTWFYGPRDRRTLPRVIKALNAGRVRVLGRGDNRINILYAADVADGAIRAAEQPAAAGRAYNLSGEAGLTQREYLDLVTDTLGYPRIERRMSLGMAYYGGFLAELIGMAIRLKRPPHWSRYVVNLITRPPHYSNARAREELGWAPRMPVEEGFRQTLAWYRAEQKVNPLLP